MKTKPHLIVPVTLLSRLLLSCQSSFEIHGASTLLQLLRQDRNRPLITVSNHCSVIDDPVLFAGILPFKILLNDAVLRKGFGAREICFTNMLYSWFFGGGGIIPIDRGRGIYQPSMGQALEVLNNNGWFHIFSEGKVVQSQQLAPFRWGVGRLVVESKVPPLIVCFYHRGLDLVMPESQFFKIPRLFNRISCRFGDVLDGQELINASKNMNCEVQRSYITDRLFQETDRLRIISTGLN